MIDIVLGQREYLKAARLLAHRRDMSAAADRRTRLVRRAMFAIYSVAAIGLALGAMEALA